MDRRSHTFQDVDALLQGLEPKPPVEALVFDRRGLVRILQLWLMERHQYRRWVAGTPAELEVVSEIMYWDEVLAWVRSQPQEELILSNRVVTP